VIAHARPILRAPGSIHFVSSTRRGVKSPHRPETVVVLGAPDDAMRFGFPWEMGRGTSDALSWA